MSIVSLLDSRIHFSDLRGHLDILHENSKVSLKRSFSKKNVFRGMHWQKSPFFQTKIIRVIDGSVIDFVVDMDAAEKEIIFKELKPESDWHVIKSNFAHGFYALEDTYFEYFCVGEYSEDNELSFSILDFLSKELNIHNPMLSMKDLNNPNLKEI